MIATFDIITEFGTGDPKLLAGGISVALVTTELGLIVAIPALLLGNLLSGWANSIKDSMEQQALHIVNMYHKSVDPKEKTIEQ
jgi:biopolymer transport protein ExbB